MNKHQLLPFNFILPFPCRLDVLMVFSFLVVGVVSGQSKKKQIELLQQKYDSLKYVSVEKGNKLLLMQWRLNQSKDSLVQILEREQQEKATITRAFQNKVNELQDQLSEKTQLLQKKRAENILLKMRIDSLMDRISNPEETEDNSTIDSQPNPNGALPYRSQRVTVSDGRILNAIFVDSWNKDMIVTDTLAAEINGKKIKIYFVTTLEQDVNVSCPYDFGFLVYDDFSNEIFKVNWISDKIGDFGLTGNTSPYLKKLSFQGKVRDILCIGNSVCGSGLTYYFYDLRFENDRLTIKQRISSTGSGYSDILFLPEKNIYVHIGKTDDVCHYGCPSRYSFTIHSLHTDSPISSIRTKLKYDDFEYIGIEELLKRVKKKEPGLITF